MCVYEYEAPIFKIETRASLRYLYYSSVISEFVVLVSSVVAAEVLFTSVFSILLVASTASVVSAVVVAEAAVSSVSWSTLVLVPKNV